MRTVWLRNKEVVNHCKSIRFPCRTVRREHEIRMVLFIPVHLLASIEGTNGQPPNSVSVRLNVLTSLYSCQSVLRLTLKRLSRNGLKGSLFSSHCIPRPFISCLWRECGYGCRVCCPFNLTHCACRARAPGCPAA